MTTRRKNYYTLITSLPPLPHLERAERLPISQYRLEQRLKMLDDEDAGQINYAKALIVWQPERPFVRDDEKMVREYRAIMEQSLHPALAEFVSFRIDQQTIMAALRRRQGRTGLPPAGQRWGAGHWVRRIEQHWDESDFHFGSVVPWVQEARGYLEAGDAVSMQRLLMNVAWQRLDRIGDRDIFGFEPVIAYVFKWDILKNWLAQDREKGKEQFQKLVEEVMNG